MDLAAVMDDLGAGLGAIPRLRVFPYWATSITPPAAVIGWPDPLDYDSTMARGADRLSLPLMVMVGAVDSRTSRDRVAAFANGTGEQSIKAALESHEPTAYDVCRVARCEFGVITVAGTEYLAATFTVDILAQGA